jgi:guanylate kinase
MNRRWVVDKTATGEIDYHFYVDDEFMAHIEFDGFLYYSNCFEFGSCNLFSDSNANTLHEAKAWCEQMVAHAIAEAICRG